MQSTKQVRSWSRRTAAMVLLAGIAAPAQLAHAQDAQGVLENRTPLGSINFITNQGQIVSYSTFGADWSGSNRLNSAGVQTWKGTAASYSGTQTIGYGVTNDVEIWFKDSYASASSQVSPANGASYSTNSYGFADPSFSVMWRALNQGRVYPFDLDFTATYAPDLLDAQAASGTADGRIARGGALFTGTAALSHVSNGNIYYLAFSAIDSSGRNLLIQPLAGSFNQKLGDYWQYSINAAYQHYFSEKFSAAAGFQYYSSDSYQVTNEGGNNLVYGRNEGAQFRPNITLNYAFVPNQVVGSLNYAHIFTDKTNNNVAAAPLNSYSIQDGQSDVVNATVRVLLH